MEGPSASGIYQFPVSSDIAEVPTPTGIIESKLRAGISGSTSSSEPNNSPGDAPGDEGVSPSVSFGAFYILPVLLVKQL